VRSASSAAAWRCQDGAGKGEERPGGAGWRREVVWRPCGNGAGNARSRGAATGQRVAAACFELKTTHARCRWPLSSRSTRDGRRLAGSAACAKGPRGAAHASAWPSGPVARPRSRAPDHDVRLWGVRNPLGLRGPPRSCPGDRTPEAVTGATWTYRCSPAHAHRLCSGDVIVNFIS
jgi:hypothetical protein